MKLYIAVSGVDEEDIKRRLRLALDNPREFIESNASSFEYDSSKKPDADGRLIYQIDYEFINEEGEAYLADLLPKS